MEFGSGLQMGLDWRTLELPDGSLIRSFGTAMPDPADSRFDEERCGVVSSDVVKQLRERLGEPLEDQRNSWAFLPPDIDLGGLHVTVAPLLPHQAGCEEFEPPMPAARDGPLIPELQVCEYLDDPDEAASGPPAGWRQIWESTDFGGGWAACEYFPGGWVFASRHPVTPQEAEAIARHQFGVGMTSEQVAGRTVYLNACGGADGECSPAIAVSAEPHLVIVIPDDDTADLRELARLVIDGLD